VSIKSGLGSSPTRGDSDWLTANASPPTKPSTDVHRGRTSITAAMCGTSGPLVPRSTSDDLSFQGNPAAPGGADVVFAGAGDDVSDSRDSPTRASHRPRTGPEHRPVLRQQRSRHVVLLRAERQRGDCRGVRLANLPAAARIGPDDRGLELEVVAIVESNHLRRAQEIATEPNVSAPGART
jgi:hypothetical protein